MRAAFDRGVLRIAPASSYDDPSLNPAQVDRRGRTETYVEVQTSLLADEHLAYLWLLFSAEALDVKGAVTELLDASKRFAGDLAVQLRDRIYKEVVPRLARAIRAISIAVLTASLRLSV